MTPAEIIAGAALLASAAGNVIVWKASAARTEVRTAELERRIGHAEKEIKENSQHRAAAQAHQADLNRRLQSIEEKLDRILELDSVRG